MFRYLTDGLPKDFEFPKTLKELGYFINDQDQIRMISDPTQKFHYFISKNKRYIEVHKAAYNECLAKIIAKRLLQLDVDVRRLPLGAPRYDRHVPVYTSMNMTSCTRCIVYIGEPTQELGILSGRIMSEESIDAGSILNFANAALDESPPEASAVAAEHAAEEATKAKLDSTSEAQSGIEKEELGLIIANPSQLIWSYSSQAAVSLDGWSALPRTSAVSPANALSRMNSIPRNGSPGAHIVCLLQDVVAKLAKRGCTINIIAADASAYDLVDVLRESWDQWKKAVTAVVVTCGHVWNIDFQDDEQEFASFWAKRARAYLRSPDLATVQPGTPLPGHGAAGFGCNVYAGGDEVSVEALVARTYPLFLEYFRHVHENPDYENTPPENVASLQDTANSENVDPGWQTSTNAPWNQEGTLQENMTTATATDTEAMIKTEAMHDDTKTHMDHGVRHGLSV